MQNSGFTFGDSESDEGDADSSYDEPGMTKSVTQPGSTQAAKPVSKPQAKRRIFVEDKQKKNIDDFLTKIKAEQSRRADGTAPVAAPPIRGIGAAAELDDPMTTNVYVGNLHPNTDEDRLQLIFGKFGPLSSVKVMWPRTPEDHARGFNSGFVSFMHRRDAERAHDTMHSACIDGHTVRLSWGKAVPRVEEPLPCLPGQVWHGSVEYEPDTAMLQGDDTLPVIVVQPPTDVYRRAEIDAAAVLVADKHGDEFEKCRVKREVLSKDPDDAVYFQWRLYSLSQGETLTEWRTEKFAMCPGDPLWLPPSCSRPRNNPPERRRESPGSNDPIGKTVAGREGTNSILHETVGSTDDGEGPSEVKSLLAHLSTLDNPLPSHVSEEFEEILEALCTGRESISNAMIFCIEHAANAGSLAAMLATLAMSAQATIDQRMACLYLFSDVLHNSASVNLKGVWAFRKRFEAILEHVFMFFRNVNAEIGTNPGEQFTEKVAVVLSVWTEWQIFSNEFLLRLERAYYGKQISNCESPAGSPKLERKVVVLTGPMPEEYVDETDPVDSASIRDKHLADARNLQCRTSNGDDSSEDGIDGIPVDTLLHN